MFIASWDPYRQLDQLQREAARVFEGRGSRWTRFGEARAYPQVNVTEDGDVYRVEALAPGIVPETLKVSAANNQLTLEGETTAGAKAGDEAVAPESYRRNERTTGKFVRTLTLPVEIDSAKVTADYRNGVLTVTLPKAESAKPRQIAVNVN